MMVSLKRIFHNLYQSVLKIRDYLRYKLSEKRENLIIILTFDDSPDESAIRIPEFLSERDIYSTFFIPPANTEDQYIEKIVSLGHEIGGHGWDHGGEEVKKHYKESASKSFNYLESFYSNLSSWRFPGLRASREAYENVKDAGFKVDSTKGSHYPVQKPRRYEGLKEFPFLRLPPRGQMDIDVNRYATISDYLLEKSSFWKGIMVLPFHTWYQNKHFEEFKELIGDLNEKDLTFKRLIDMSSEF